MATDEQFERVANFQSHHSLRLATLFFCDLVGSMQMKQTLGDPEAVRLLQLHHAAFRELLGRFRKAQEISTAGDSLFLVFSTPSDAVRFALLAQARNRQLSRENGAELRDRIGIHVGEVLVKSGEDSGAAKDLFGLHVDTCSRVMSLGAGDQILMTRFAYNNARQSLRATPLSGVGELAWRVHGFYQVQGVEEAVEICEVGEIGLAVLEPPGDSGKSKRIRADDYGTSKEGNGASVSLTSGATIRFEAQEGAEAEPVTGWLVVVQGMGRGRSLALGYGRHSIGRGDGQRVRINFGDKAISRREHVTITYDVRGRAFYITPGSGASLAYLNGQPILQASPLVAKDRIGIGKTELVFIPFCGLEFEWQQG